MRPRNVLIYDAECRFCVASRRWLQRWDRHRRVTFLPFQTAEARAFLPELAGASCMDAMRFVDDQGRVSAGVEALRNMLPLLPMGRLLAHLFRIPGFSHGANFAYRHLARNRYRWFGSVP